AGNRPAAIQALKRRAFADDEKLCRVLSALRSSGSYIGPPNSRVPARIFQAEHRFERLRDRTYRAGPGDRKNTRLDQTVSSFRIRSYFDKCAARRIQPLGE